MNFHDVYATMKLVTKFPHPRVLGLAPIYYLLSFCLISEAQAKPLVFWHNQVGLQARFVERLIEEFNARRPSKNNIPEIRGETGLELETALMSRIDPVIRPDLMLIPSDAIGLKEELGLTRLPPSWSGILKDIQIGIISSASHGVPILRGNQLYLFYNKRFVSEVPGTWPELKRQHELLTKKGIQTIGWPYSEPYYFLPFLQAFGTFDPRRLDVPAMHQALEFYRELSTSGIVKSACGLDCNTTRFYRGEVAFAISGDWSMAEARSRLKDQLGVAPLPAISGTQPLISGEEIQYLVFPNAKTFAKYEKFLREFSEFLLSDAVQARWEKEAERVPVLARHKPQLSLSARLVPEDRSVPHAWIALRKGLQLLKSGEKAIPKKMQEHLNLSIRSERHPGEPEL